MVIVDVVVHQFLQVLCRLSRQQVLLVHAAVVEVVEQQGLGGKLQGAGAIAHFP